MSLKGNVVQHRLIGFICKSYVLKDHTALNRAEPLRSIWYIELVALAEQLRRAVQASGGLRQLRADIHDLEDGLNHGQQQYGVLHIAAHRHLSSQHLMTA